MDFYKQQAEEFVNMKKRRDSQAPSLKSRPRSWLNRSYYESVEPDREFLAYTEKLNPFRSKEVQLSLFESARHEGNLHNSLEDLVPERKDLF